MKKLSKPMEDMIRGAEIHEVRVNGEIVKSGYVIAGNTNTVVALMDRKLTTAATAEFHGLHWLTEDGLLIRAGLIYDNVSDVDRAAEDMRINAREAAIEADNARLAEDHPTQSDMITDDQPTRERIAQLAAVSHYRNATSDDANHGAVYEASKAHMMSAGVAAYPDLTGKEIYELIHSFNEGESLKDLVEIFRADRAACMVDEVAESISAKIAASGLRGNVKIRAKPWVTAHIETNELPYDAERIWDAENAALEGADIRTEYEAEVADEERHAALVDELIAEIYADDRLMYLTSKGVFVSGEYVNTMRRIADVQRGNASGFALRRQHMIDDAPNLFALIDSVLEAGKITFGEADREKRRIRAHCRPSVLTGRKHKPSSRRRNRR